MALFVLFASAAFGQFRAGARIDAAPVRVEGVIARVIPQPKGGESYEISYVVDGRTYRTEDLRLDPALLRQARVGLAVPLEVAADDPATARAAGADHPDDDVTPAFVLAALASAVAAVFCLWFGRRPTSDLPSRAG
ncbi:hypothetical protein ACF07V_04390 [Streptomyces sp. NPDC015661]|uniref:hypothetical protein n=1 Tax=Streptomyces sp. NPDC015661 TaxID=3364961 RepID=UPI0036FCA773